MKLFSIFLLLLIPVAGLAQFNFITNSGEITIVGYTGAGGSVIFPSMTNGLTVTGIALPQGRGVSFTVSTNLSDVTIPSSITSIDLAVFRSWKKLLSINVNKTNPAYSSIDGVLLNKNGTTLLVFPRGRVGAYQVTNNISIISDSAFSGCSLTNISISETVTDIGTLAFAGNTLLTSIKIPNSVTSIGQQAFQSCSNLASVVIPGSVPVIRTYTFYYCTSLTNVAIGNGVIVIDVSAFYGCYSLSRVTIPDSATSIGSQAFIDCYALTNVTVGANVTDIGDAAFLGCVSLKGIFCKGNAPTIGASVLGYAYDAIFYYLPNTIGWATFVYPAVLWNPTMQTTGGSFGVQNNQFGFNITGSTNIPMVVEASSALTQPEWTPLLNCVLTNGTVFFRDPEWASYPNRCYRIRSP